MLAIDPGLMEIAHGTWEGLLAAEIRARDPDRLVAWRDAPHEVLMPEGESLQHVFDRAWPALARAVEGLGVDDTVLVVAHDAVNRVLLCRVLGIPLARLWTFRQAPTTLNLLEGADVDHLRSEEPTSELQSLMRISYAVFCLKKKNKIPTRLK